MVDFSNLVTQTQALFANTLGVQAQLEGSSVEIAEVNGDLTVVLRGRAMPYREVEYPVEQHVQTDWYPGNPVASQQVMGPREQKTTLKGKWKDRFIRGSVEVSDGQEIRFAADLVALFHRLTRQGRLLRVSWFSEIRTGYLVKFTPTYDRPQDIAWEAEFEWQSRDDQLLVREEDATPSPRTGFDLFGALQDAVGTIGAIVDLTNNWVAAVVTSIDEIGDSIAGIARILEVAATLTSLPATLMGALTAAVGQLVRLVTSLLRQIVSPRGTTTPIAQYLARPAVPPTSRRASAAGNRSRSGAAPPASAIANTARFEVWRRSVGLAATNISDFALSELRRIEARDNPRTTRVVTVPEQQTLYSLSLRYYGSPDFAGYLAAVNRLGGGNVAAGTRLRVPPRPVGTTLPQPGSSTSGGVCNG